MATLEFNGRGYDYDANEAYDRGLIVLPDGTVLRPRGWLESMPPQLAGFDVVPVAKAVLR